MRNLFTRDGRRIGNAIIIREVQPHPEAAHYFTKTGQKLWLIETDFGNQLRFSDNEIEEHFYRLDELNELQQIHCENTTYDEWSADRRRLQNSTRTLPAQEEPDNLN